ncbi:MAG TPA: hypothetical protein VIK53_08385 [Verrucomicrobiae bacterium]
MNQASANSSALAAVPPHRSWSRRKLISLIALAFAAHVALIFIFGTKKQIQPRPVTNVPQFRLANPSDELVALGNPALFVLPNPHDFSSAIWLKTPVTPMMTNHWTEPPQWLQPVAQNLGAMLSRFMQTNRPGGFQFDFKPRPQFANPDVPAETGLPQNSTLQIRGELAQRLLAPPALPSLPVNDIIAPSKVQVLVDPSGNVVSAVLLPSDNPLEALGRSAIGDASALTFARSLRFSPAKQPVSGEIIFNWHTVPLTSTNAPVRP